MQKKFLDGFVPYRDRILVERLPPAANESTHLIVNPYASDQQRTWRGKVIAVGNKLASPEAIKVGDIIFWGKYAGDTIPEGLKHEEDFKNLSLIFEDDVLGIEEEE